MSLIDDLIFQLKGLDLSIAADETVVKLVSCLDKIIIMSTEINPGSFVLRARADLIFNPYYYEKNISYIRDLNFIPPYNRASLKGESLFYGCIPSVDRDESYFYMQTAGEVGSLVMKKFQDHAYHEEYITMGKWRVRDKFNLFTVANHSEFIDKNSQLMKLNKKLNFFLNQYPDKKSETLKALDYFSSEFAKPVSDSERHQYKISAAFSAHLMNLGLDGILYPSVRGNGDGFCIAISPSVVDSCLQLEKVAVFRALKKKDKFMLLPYLYCDKFSSEGKFIYEDPGVWLSALQRECVLDNLKS